MKVFLFGAGKLYREFYQRIINLKNIEILGIIDNNTSIIGEKVDDFYVFAPEYIQEVEFDKVIITNTYIKEIKKQLSLLGISKKKITSVHEFLEYFSGEKIKFFGHNSENIDSKKSILAFTYDIQFDGSTIALQNALLLLKSKNIRVSIAAVSGNIEYIQQLNNMGINIYLYPYLQYSDLEKLSFIKKYDSYIVNTFLMYKMLSILPKSKLTLWWIHEARECYEKVKLSEGLPALTSESNIKIALASDAAKKIFNEFYPNINCDILHIPILGWHKDRKKNSLKKIFILSGYLSPIKGYDIFLDAVSLMEEKDCEFWILGRYLNDEYGCKVIERINKLKNVLYKGEVTQDELINIYDEIFGVIVPSRFETVSMSGIEALMNKKYLIISNNTGLSRYLNPEIAMIFENENSKMLAKMLDIMCRGEVQLDLEEGYKVYKKYFSAQRFLENISKLLFLSSL